MNKPATRLRVLPTPRGEESALLHAQGESGTIASRPAPIESPALTIIGGVEAGLSPEQHALVLSVRALVEHEVSRMAPDAKGPRRDELVSSGVWGAMRAAARYDPTKETAFSTYAVPWIRGEIYGARRGAARRKLVDRARLEIGAAYTAEHPGDVKVRRFSDRECSIKLNRLCEHLFSAMVVAEAQAHLDPEAALAERQEHEATMALVNSHIDAMPPKTRAVFVLWFRQRKTRKEIANELCVDDKTVWRRLERGLSELRKALKAAGIPHAATLHDREWAFARSPGDERDDGKGER